MLKLIQISLAGIVSLILMLSSFQALATVANQDPLLQAVYQSDDDTTEGKKKKADGEEEEPDC